jgi:hypothetical protein
VSLFHVNCAVTRQGDLVSVDARANLQPVPGDPERKLDITLKGQVVRDEFRGMCELHAEGGKTPQPLESIRLVTANAFAPFQPLQKYAPLRPGQSWQASNIDLLGELLYAARPAVAKIIGDATPLPLPDRRPPTEVVARVQERMEDVVSLRGRRRTCWVIVFEADEVLARTWVDVADGKVVRQEANGLGETIAFVRD